MNEMIGWASSGILLATLIAQIYKQWKLNTRKGVSKWLFVGQLATSIGFVIYSVGTGNLVFIITNSFLAVSAVIGIYIYFTSRNG
jgi:MtN3 and saliva related transmembrane protein